MRLHSRQGDLPGLPALHKRVISIQAVALQPPLRRMTDVAQACPAGASGRI